MLRYVTYLLPLMYICLERGNEKREREKRWQRPVKKREKKKQKKKREERKVVRHPATFLLTNIGLFFLLSAAQIPQRGSKYD